VIVKVMVMVMGDGEGQRSKIVPNPAYDHFVLIPTYFHLVEFWRQKIVSLLTPNLFLATLLFDAYDATIKALSFPLLAPLPLQRYLSLSRAPYAPHCHLTLMSSM
jgi:hypothetical protein